MRLNEKNYFFRFSGVTVRLPAVVSDGVHRGRPACTGALVDHGTASYGQRRRRRREADERGAGTEREREREAAARRRQAVRLRRERGGEAVPRT